MSGAKKIVRAVAAPDDAYPVLMQASVWEGLRLRTDDGYRLLWDWGQPDPDGWYTPSATIDYSDRLNVVERGERFGSDD